MLSPLTQPIITKSTYHCQHNQSSLTQPIITNTLSLLTHPINRRKVEEWRNALAEVRDQAQENLHVLRELQLQVSTILRLSHSLELTLIPSLLDLTLLSLPLFFHTLPHQIYAVQANASMRDEAIERLRREVWMTDRKITQTIAIAFIPQLCTLLHLC